MPKVPTDAGVMSFRALRKLIERHLKEVTAKGLKKQAGKVAAKTIESFPPGGITKEVFREGGELKKAAGKYERRVAVGKAREELRKVKADAFAKPLKKGRRPKIAKSTEVLRPKFKSHLPSTKIFD